jgi:hypothetical protein
VLEALGVLAFGSSDVSDIAYVSDVLRGDIEFTAEHVVQQIKALADSEQETEWATARRVGWQLGSLRVAKKRDPSTKKRTRLRTISKADVFGLLCSYGLVSNERVDACVERC